MSFVDTYRKQQIEEWQPFYFKYLTVLKVLEFRWDQFAAHHGRILDKLEANVTLDTTKKDFSFKICEVKVRGIDPASLSESDRLLQQALENGQEAAGPVPDEQRSDGHEDIPFEQQGAQLTEEALAKLKLVSNVLHLKVKADVEHATFGREGTSVSVAGFDYIAGATPEAIELDEFAAAEDDGNNNDVSEEAVDFATAASEMQPAEKALNKQHAKLMKISDDSYAHTTDSMINLDEFQKEAIAQTAVAATKKASAESKKMGDFEKGKKSDEEQDAEAAAQVAEIRSELAVQQTEAPTVCTDMSFASPVAPAKKPSSVKTEPIHGDAGEENDDEDESELEKRQLMLHPRLGVAVHRLQKLISAFAVTLNAELTKVINFSAKQEAMLSAAAGSAIESVKQWEHLTAKERDQLQVTFRQVYFTLDMLQQYCDLNYLAMGTLLKDFDHITGMNSQQAYTAAFQDAPFVLSTTESRLQALKKQMHRFYTKFACEGKSAKAYEVLYMRDRAEKIRDELPVALSLGLLIGALGILFALIAVEYANIGQPLESYNTHTASFWFSTSLVPILAMILFSFNVMIWERYKINYAFLFDLDPVFHWTGKQLLRDQLWYLFFWACTCYAFLRTVFQDVACDETKADANSVVPAWIWPYVVMPLLIIWALGRAIVDPHRLLNSERWFLRTLKRILLTPLYPVLFSDFFVCAQLRSLAATWYELQFFWCYFHVSGWEDECDAGYRMKLHILPIIPAYWRCVQCLMKYREAPPAKRNKFPHFWNAMKYVVDMIATLSIAFHGSSKQFSPDGSTMDAALTLFIICRIANSVYKIIFDLFVDTALLEFHPKKVPSWFPWKIKMRQNLIFPKAFYFVFFVVNPILRFQWVGKFTTREFATKDLWVWFVFGFSNVFRRFLWNTLRVENEQVNNIENYKATKLAPLPMRSRGVELLSSSTDSGTTSPSTTTDAATATAAPVTNASLGDVQLLEDLFHDLSSESMVRILSHALSTQKREPFLKSVALVAASDEATKKRMMTTMFHRLPVARKVHGWIVFVGDARFIEVVGDLTSKS